MLALSHSNHRMSLVHYVRLAAVSVVFTLLNESLFRLEAGIFVLDLSGFKIVPAGLVFILDKGVDQGEQVARLLGRVVRGVAEDLALCPGMEIGGLVLLVCLEVAVGPVKAH